jgi:hypothetical protein
MGFETPKFEAPKKELNNVEQYKKEAMDIAQRISCQWQKLKDKQPIAYPQLNEIWQANRPPKTGIQIWFEGQLDFIEKQAGYENAKSRMMYRVKEDLERIEEKINDIVGYPNFHH